MRICGKHAFIQDCTLRRLHLITLPFSTAFHTKQPVVYSCAIKRSLMQRKMPAGISAAVPSHFDCLIAQLRNPFRHRRCVDLHLSHVVQVSRLYLLAG